MAVRQNINLEKYTTEELLKMKKDEATEGLNEKQQRFCEYYVTSYNIKTAMIRAGYAPETNAPGYAIRKRPAAQRYIQWLKARIMQDTMVRGSDIIEQWVKISFADMSDFIDIERNNLRLKPMEQVDGQLIKSIKTGPTGTSIELYDKLKALESLSRYTADMPSDYKRILEERRQELLEEEFELKKRMSEAGYAEPQDDGFLEAVAKSVESVWENK